MFTLQGNDNLRQVYLDWSGNFQIKFHLNLVLTLNNPLVFSDFPVVLFGLVIGN